MEKTNGVKQLKSIRRYLTKQIIENNHLIKYSVKTRIKELEQKNREFEIQLINLKQSNHGQKP